MTKLSRRFPLAESEAQEPEQGAMVPHPLDGGWGWVVVFASFMIHVIADGVTYTFGIFYMEFLKHFGESKGMTAWVASIMVGTTYCIGPVASGLTNRYGCRAVTIAGAILAAAGLIFSLFVSNILCLYFTIGICAGAGFGLMYLPSIVSVTCYFEKKRAFATGMAVCGSGLGTFALAPLTECLVEYYGWKGAMLIIAGLVLNCAVFGALFRPLENSLPSSYGKTLDEKPDICDSYKEACNGQCLPNDDIESSMRLLPKECSKERNVNLVQNGCQPESLNDIRSNGRHSSAPDPHAHDGNVLHKNRLLVPSTHASNPSSPSTQKISKVQSELTSFDLKPDPESSIVNGVGERKLAKKDSLTSRKSVLVLPTDILRRKLEGMPLSSFVCSSSSLAQTNKELSELEFFPQSGVMYRKDIFYSGSLQNIPRYRSNPNICYATVSSLDKIPPAKKRHFLCCPREVYDALLEMTDFSLLRNVAFLMFGISNFLTNIGFNVPYIYTKDRVSDLGIAKDEDASFLLAIIGISNTVGRVTLGYLSDRAFVNRLWVYNISLIISGLATALSCYATDYTLMMAYCATFGATAGAYVSLTSVILVDLLGLDKLTNAFGLLLVFEGISCLLGPPITGWLYDGSGSYDPGFYVSGSMIAVSGLMLFFVPCISKPSSSCSLATHKSSSKKPTEQSTISPEDSTILYA